MAGLVAALTAAFILVVGAKWIHMRHLERLDVRQIQEVLTDGRRRVMEKSKETFNQNMNGDPPCRCASGRTVQPHDQAVEGCLGPYDVETVLRQKEGYIRRA